MKKRTSKFIFQVGDIFVEFSLLIGRDKLSQVVNLYLSKQGKLSEGNPQGKSDSIQYKLEGIAAKFQQASLFLLSVFHYIMLKTYIICYKEALNRGRGSPKKLGTSCKIVLTYWEMIAASLILRYALPLFWRLPSVITHILNLYYIIV